MSMGCRLLSIISKIIWLENAEILCGAYQRKVVKSQVLKVFGENLRILREQKGISQEHLAEIAGLHRTYLGGVERGERNPTLLTIVKISRGLEIPPSILLNINVDFQDNKLNND